MSQAYEELLSRNPRDARILFALARMHVKKGDLAEGGRVLGEALELEPKSLPARALLMNVHRRLGDLSGALDEMETILQCVPPEERFVCAECGTTTDEYWTRCPTCSAWSPAA
jgi:lipopolysaccharide biosynthesis regulator YciM